MDRLIRPGDLNFRLQLRYKPNPSVQVVFMPKKILIVDDDPSIIVALQFLMEQNGYQTLVAFSGEEAMETITEYRPDLILLDIMLPVVDGFEVCQRVRENPEWSNIRIVLVTALGSDVNVTKGLSLGADAYIIKPFSNAEILAKVKELLAGGA
jgi:DNA-binding response OmpR family regulator